MLDVQGTESPLWLRLPGTPRQRTAIGKKEEEKKKSTTVLPLAPFSVNLARMWALDATSRCKGQGSQDKRLEVTSTYFWRGCLIVHIHVLRDPLHSRDLIVPFLYLDAKTMGHSRRLH